MVLANDDKPPPEPSVCLVLWQLSTSGRQSAAVLRLDSAALDSADGYATAYARWK